MSPGRLNWVRIIVSCGNGCGDPAGLSIIAISRRTLVQHQRLDLADAGRMRYVQSLEAISIEDAAKVQSLFRKPASPLAPSAWILAARRRRLPVSFSRSPYNLWSTRRAL